MNKLNNKLNNTHPLTSLAAGKKSLKGIFYNSSIFRDSSNNLQKEIKQNDQLVLSRGQKNKPDSYLFPNVLPIKKKSIAKDTKEEVPEVRLTPAKTGKKDSYDELTSVIDKLP